MGVTCGEVLKSNRRAQSCICLLGGVESSDGVGQNGCMETGSVVFSDGRQVLSFGIVVSFVGEVQERAWEEESEDGGDEPIEREGGRASVEGGNIFGGREKGKLGRGTHRGGEEGSPWGNEKKTWGEEVSVWGWERENGRRKAGSDGAAMLVSPTI